MTTSRLRRFVGVYHAEGTVRGELSYWFGKRLGNAHCGLCDITHGTFRERADWRSCRDELPAPFDTYHLDDQPDEVRGLTAGRTPTVLAETTTGWVVLAGPEDLDTCAASPEALVERLRAALDEHDIAADA